MSARTARWIGTIGLVMLAGAVAGPARAQEVRPTPPTSSQAPNRASGAWFGGGGGYLSFRSDCESCEHGNEYTGGRGILISGGIAVNERFDAGAELFTAFSGNDLFHYRTSYLLAVAQFRPWVNRGFFLKGGFGLAFFRGGITSDGQDGDVASRGLGVHYGAGWIFRQGRRVSFAPFGAQYVATIGDITLPSTVLENVVTNSWLAGVVVLIR